MSVWPNCAHEERCFGEAVRALRWGGFLDKIRDPVESLHRGATGVASKMSLLRPLILMLAVLPTLASGGWINKQGEGLPDAENRRAAGDFGAQLILVGDEKELFKRWATPSETVDVKTIDSVKVNGVINAFVVFGGRKPDTKGNCSVAVRFRLIQPDGKVYAETPPMEVWENKPVPGPKVLELSVQYLKVRIEPEDQLGRYLIQAQVRDNNAGIVLQLQSRFTASRGAP